MTECWFWQEDLKGPSVSLKRGNSIASAGEFWGKHGEQRRSANGNHFQLVPAKQDTPEVLLNTSASVWTLEKIY